MLKSLRLSIFLPVILIVLPIGASASTGDAGTESIFNFGVDARAVGMGRAFTGIADNASAIYWNPGGLAYLERKELDALYVPLYDATDYGFVSFAYPISRYEVLGIGLMGVSIRNIPKTDVYDTDQGSFSDLQMQALLSYSRVWWNYLAAGVNVKFYYHGLDTYNGTGIGLDGGLYYDARELLPGLTLGAMVTNALMPRVTLISEPDVYPLNFRLGAAYRFALDSRENHRLLISVEGEKSEYTGYRPHAGVEYLAFKFVSLRAGWDQDHLTAGAGLSVWDWRLDYAMTFQEGFGNLSLFSLTWQFGPSLSEEEASRNNTVLLDLLQTKSREHNRLGSEYMSQGKYEEAVDEFEKALSWIGESTEIVSNLKKAQDALRTQQTEKQMQIGQKYYQQGLYLEAMLSWQAVSRLNPQYPGLQGKISGARSAMEEQLLPPKAKAKRKVARNEQQSLDLFRAGISDYLDEKFSAAVQKWERALKLNPRLPQAREYLAKALKHLQPEDRGKGMPPLTAGQKQQCEQYYSQGLLQYRQQRFAEARDLWKRALAIDPDHINAKRGLERVEAILKVFEEKGVK